MDRYVDLVGVTGRGGVQCLLAEVDGAVQIVQVPGMLKPAHQCLTEVALADWPGGMADGGGVQCLPAEIDGAVQVFGAVRLFPGRHALGPASHESRHIG